MKAKKELTARERMVRARKRMLDRAPYYGVLSMDLTLVEDASIETMATDAVSLFYNPAFVDTMSDAELMAVVVHEVNHCTRGHCDPERMAGRDHEQWNEAGDYVINTALVREGYALPQGALIDDRFDRLSIEEAYSIIQRERDQGRRGAPQPQPGGVLPTPAIGRDGRPLEASEVTAQWAEKAKQATAIARKAGKLAGVPVETSITTSAATLGDPVYNWRAVLREFIDEQGTRDANWNTPNKRFAHAGLYLPSEKPIRPSRICWMVDVSGSMDKRANRAAMTEGQAALDDMAVDALTVVYVDTEKRHVDEYETGDTMTLRDATGGGTDFRTVMAWAADQEFSAIVFVTDGATVHGIDPGCPVLWAVTDTADYAATVPVAAGYGQAVSLYTS